MKSTENKKMARILNLIQFLHSEPRTIEECVAHIGSSQNTVYRYLGLFKETGFRVTKVAKQKFYIKSFDEVQKNVHEVAEKSINLDLEIKNNSVVDLLRSKYFRKKPFVVEIYGEWTNNNSVNFSHKISGYKGNSFSEEEIKKIKVVFSNIATNILISV